MEPALFTLQNELFAKPTQSPVLGVASNKVRPVEVVEDRADVLVLELDGALIAANPSLEGTIVLGLAVRLARQIGPEYREIICDDGFDLVESARWRACAPSTAPERISAVGGRTIATALIDQRIAQDLSLTTSAIDGGEPSTPFYRGQQRPSASDPAS